MKKKIKLIIKFLGREANLFELERLGKIIEKRKAKNEFDKLVKIHYLLSFGMKHYDVNEAKSNFRSNIVKNKKRHLFKSIQKVGIAASVLLLVGITIFYSKRDHQASEETTVQAPIKAGTDRAILTLDNGDQIVLEEGKQYISEKVNGNGKSLKYQTKNNETVTSYNYLTIPRGGQFELTLPDGTRVWLNSDTKLKYPVSFKNNKPREVELVYGEVFLKVSPSSKHNGSVFNLISNEQVVQVLGTEFNVRAYADEDEIKTTLLEGSVSIKRDIQNTLLKPNQQSIFNLASNNIEIKKVNAAQEISWVNGLFTFDTESLEEIMKTLARWYDVEVVFESANLKEFVFTGILERSSSINDILKHVEASSEGNLKFIASDRTIIIQEPMK